MSRFVCFCWVFVQFVLSQVLHLDMFSNLFSDVLRVCNNSVPTSINPCTVYPSLVLLNHLLTLQSVWGNAGIEHSHCSGSVLAWVSKIFRFCIQIMCCVHSTQYFRIVNINLQYFLQAIFIAGITPLGMGSFVVLKPL